MPPARPKARVLLIDDETYFCKFLTSLFEEERVEVAACTYGAEGLALLEKERFDLIVVDYQLPDMLGTEILETLRARGVETPRIMVTAYGSIDVAVRAMKIGADDFFTKPLEDPHAFIRFLHRTLSGVGTQDAALPAHAPEAERPAEPESAVDAFADEVRRARALCDRLDPPVELSRREYEILAALMRGLSNKEIAAALFISERTVKNHLTHIYAKFDVDSRSQLFNRMLMEHD